MNLTAVHFRNEITNKIGLDWNEKLHFSLVHAISLTSNHWIFCILGGNNLKSHVQLRINPVFGPIESHTSNHHGHIH